MRLWHAVRQLPARMLASLRARRGGRASSGTTLPEKADQWQGYYAPQILAGQQRGIPPAQILDEQWVDGRIPAERILPYISPSAIVLEIACGVGRVSRFVAPRCRRLYCTDILEEALHEARATLREYANVSFQQTNGYDLRGLESGTFDCVYSFTTFFHFDFELVTQYFREIGRVLKPGGIGMIEFKKLTQTEELIQLLDKIEQHGGIRSYEAMLDKWRYVSAEMLELLCRHCGLAVIDPDVTRFTFSKIPDPATSRGA